MFFRKKDKKENITDKIKTFQITPDFIEKSIFIPTINQQIDAISELFKQIEKIYNELQNVNSRLGQQYVKDFDSMMINYYEKTFITYDSKRKEQIHKEAKNQSKKARELLLRGISSHLEQYMNNLNSLEKISSKELKIEKISEYMINIKKIMLNIIEMKNKIFSIVLPMTTLIFIDSKTKEEQRIHSDHPIKRIGLLPFETLLDEISLFCKNGVESIDSWFKHLKNKRIRYIEAVVNQSKVQVAQDQAKAAKWTFYTQLGFIGLSVLFIIVSFFLSEYKKDWVDFFNLLIR